MADTSLTFDILARDKGASRTANRVADAVARIDNNTKDTNSSLAKANRAFQFLGVNGLKSVGLVAAAIATLPAAATLAAGALTLGLGGAIAGIGALAVGTTKKMKKEFAEFGKFAVKTIRQAAKPMRPVLMQVLKTGRQVLKGFAPVLRDFFKQTKGPLIGFIRDLGDAFLALRPMIGPLADGFNRLLKSLGPALPVIFKGIADGIISIVNAVAANPQMFTMLVSGLAKLGVAGLKAIAGLTRFFTWIVTVAIPAVRQFAAAVRDKLTAVWSKLMAVIRPVMPLLRTLGTFLKTTFLSALQDLKLAWRDFTAAIVVLKPFLPVIKAAAKGLALIIGGVLVAALVSVVTMFRIAAGVIRVVAGLFKWVAGVASSSFERVLDGARTVGRFFRVTLPNAVSNGVDRAISFVRSLPGRIRSAVGNLGHLLVSAGRSVIQGLINGIRSALGGLRSMLSSVTGLIPSWKGPLSADRKLLEPAGQAIMSGLISGIDGELPALRSKLTAVSRVAQATMRAQRSPMQRAAREMLRHFTSGGRLFEDFSFRGQSALGGRLNDRIAEMFHSSGRRNVEAFLRNLAGPPPSAQAGTREQVVTVRLVTEGAEEDVQKLMRKIVRVDGHGDVQAAFG